jgi:transcriptional regulator with XRE-family HTH domain
MPKIGRRVAKWIDSQTQIAQEMGIASSAISSYISGKRQLPLPRFLQIVHNAKPPQDDIDDIFNMYLGDLGIPDGAIRLLRAGADIPGSPVEGTVIRDARIAKITELVMASEDIPAEAKVAVYNIIQSTRKK